MIGPPFFFRPACGFLIVDVVHVLFAEGAVVEPVVAHPAIDHGIHRHRDFQRRMRIHQRHQGRESVVAIGGIISGLSGTVVLQDNNTDNYSTSTNGPFIFATALSSGATYNVTVLTQPAGQTCVVGNGSGTVSGANVTNVTVTCGSAPTISSFSASPSLVALNGTSTLSWTVASATSLSISPAIGTVTGSSTTTPALSTTTLYTLTAVNSNGTSTATTTVSVATAPTAPGSFSVTGTTASSAS